MRFSVSKHLEEFVGREEKDLQIMLKFVKRRKKG